MAGLTPSRAAGSLGSRTSGILLLRGLWAGLALVSNLLIARLYGADWAGTYFLSLAVVTVCATLAQLGTDLPVMRLAAVAQGESDWGVVRGLLRSASLLALAAGGALTMLVLAGAGLAGTLFSDRALPVMLRLMALAIIPYTLVLLQARAFMAIGKPAIAETTHRLGFQIVFTALIVLLATRLGGSALGIAFAVTYWALLVAARWRWRRAVPAPTVTARVPWPVLLRPGLPILATASIQLVVDWSDTLMVGYFLTAASVGVYGVALRVSSTMALVLGAAGSVFGPRFATLHATGDRGALGQLARQVTVGCALAALPLLAAVLLIPGWILGLFGTEFVIGSATLRILAVGQFANVASGLVGLLLAMTGHERQVLMATMLSAVLNVALDFVLIPRHGIEGAAIATAASLVVVNGANIYLVRRKLGIRFFAPTRRHAGG